MLDIIRTCHRAIDSIVSAYAESEYESLRGNPDIDEDVPNPPDEWYNFFEIEKSEDSFSGVASVDARIANMLYHKIDSEYSVWDIMKANEASCWLRLSNDELDDLQNHCIDKYSDILDKFEIHLIVLELPVSRYSITDGHLYVIKFSDPETWIYHIDKESDNAFYYMMPTRIIHENFRTS